MSRLIPRNVYGPRDLTAGLDPSYDQLLYLLARLDAEGKLVSAWFLPKDNPTRDLTFFSGSVDTWAAAAGSHRTTLLTPGPHPDLYANEPSIHFNGVDDYMEASTTHWPAPVIIRTSTTAA